MNSVYMLSYSMSLFEKLFAYRDMFHFCACLIPTLYDMIIPHISLSNHSSIPQLGLGLFQVPAGEDTVKLVHQAISLGYRHFDTAHIYGNESSLGYAIASSGIPRHDFWLTSKLWPSDYGITDTPSAIDNMLRRFQTDYLDLLLLHHPYGNYEDAWQAMEKAYQQGKIRAVGLSNFSGDCLQKITGQMSICPQVVQAECHPYYQQSVFRQTLADMDIAFEAWYPLGHGNKKLLSDPVISAIASSLHKSPAQVILRWQLEEGNIIFPRTLNPEHLASNLDILSFTLSQEQMLQIRSLDRDKRIFRMSADMEERFVWSMKPAD